MNSRMQPHLWIKCSTLIVFTTITQIACDLQGASGPQLLVPDLKEPSNGIRQVTSTPADMDVPLVARKPEFSIEA